VVFKKICKVGGENIAKIPLLSHSQVVVPLFHLIFVVQNYPDLWKEFKDWAKSEKLLNQ